MRHTLYLILLLSVCHGIAPKSNKSSSKDSSIHIKIPAEWIDKLRRFEYTGKPDRLLQEFDSLIRPDSLVNPHTEHVDTAYGRVCSAMFVDLDGEPGEELICLLGWDVGCPSLCVFKEREGNWYLIYLEKIETFYGAPTLYVANCRSKNKTFYLRRNYTHGSGVYADGFSFYKLINDKVYPCLDLVNRAEIVAWGLYLNQNVKLNFEFSDYDDEILANYTYNFYPGQMKDSDCSYCMNEDVPLVRGESSANYIWNTKSMTYELDSLSDLTAEKIACFYGFGKDSLFIRAFSREIDQTLKTGTPQQKMILKEYLGLVKKDSSGTHTKF